MALGDAPDALREANPHLKEVTMTILEEAEVKGRVEGKAEALEMMLVQRFGDVSAQARGV